MKICRHCGRENDDDDTVCQECGTGIFRSGHLPPPLPALGPDVARPHHLAKPDSSVVGSALRLLAILGLVLLLSFVFLRGFSLIRRFLISTAGMAPAR